MRTRNASNGNLHPSWWFIQQYVHKGETQQALNILKSLDRQYALGILQHLLEGSRHSAISTEYRYLRAMIVFNREEPTGR